MHGGRPSARHEERVAGDFSLSATMLDANGIDSQAAVSAEDLGAGNDLDARGLRGIRQRAFGFGAQVDNQRDAHARLLEVERSAVSAVVRGRDDDAVADLGAILKAITSRGIGEHHGGAVIIRKDERTLDRAGRQHHLTRAHLP